MMEEEFSHSRHDARGEKGPNKESEDSKHLIHQKRQKTENDAWTPWTTTKNYQTFAERILVVSQTDVEAIQKLKEIEKSHLPNDLLSMKLQSLCAMLP